MRAGHGDLEGPGHTPDAGAAGAHHADADAPMIAVDDEASQVGSVLGFTCRRARRQGGGSEQDALGLGGPCALHGGVGALRGGLQRTGVARGRGGMLGARGDGIVRGCLALERTRHRGDAGHRARAVQHTGESEVLLLGDRVELVVVAPRAAERLAHEGTTDDIDLLIDHVEDELLLVGLGEHLGAQHQEPSGRDAIGGSGG